MRFSPTFCEIMSTMALVISAAPLMAEDEWSGARVTVGVAPRSFEDSVTFKNPDGSRDHVTVDGSLDQHARIALEWVSMGEARPVAVGCAWGAYVGQRTITSETTARDIGIIVEPIIAWSPWKKWRLESSISGTLGYLADEMPSYDGLGNTKKVKSKNGMSYDVTAHLRPVWQVAKRADVFIELTYTPFMQSEATFSDAGMTVTETRTYRGFGGGVGGTLRF